VNVSFLQELLGSIAEQGRQLLPWTVGTQTDIVALSRALVSSRGEASGVAIAGEILDLYRRQTRSQRAIFYDFLTHGLSPEPAAVAEKAKAYLATPGPNALAELQRVVDSPRQEFFRRLNLAPGATSEIVALRKEILGQIGEYPQLKAIDADLRHLLNSWFNRGFLVLRRIDWNTPAAILEKIIAYEAVHEIKGWEDLRRRLEPADRRCFAFFHPSLIDDPLIFVEVALMDATPGAIADVLSEAAKPQAAATATTAVFYSISNCQEGLRGISFGNFLIKQVVEELVRERPGLTTFVTLSPVPGFARWLNRGLADADPAVVATTERGALAGLSGDAWTKDPETEARLQPHMLTLAARYMLTAKAADGRPADPVARFHLGNGARLERVNWPADRSNRGLREAHGLMVNYRYDLKEIEANHEAYANENRVVAARSVRALLKTPDRASVTQRLLDFASDTDASAARRSSKPASKPTAPGEPFPAAKPAGKTNTPG
jgi:malonyl-CoA decarboxylase